MMIPPQPCAMLAPMRKGWTYQTLIDGGMTVQAYCHACNHSESLNLEALRDRFGPDAPAMADDIIPKLKCKKCQSKKVGLIYSPEGNKALGMGKNLYAKSKGV